MSLRTARVSFLIAAGLLVTGYYLVPAARPFAAGLYGALIVSAMTFGIARGQPQRWSGWALITVAVVILTAGDVSFAALVSYDPTPTSYPGLPDIFYLLTYPPLAIGLLVLGRPAIPSRDVGMLVDVVSLSLAGSLIIWITLVRPAIVDIRLDSGGKVVALASWVGFVAVLAAGARVAMDWYRVAALRWLSVGVLAFLVSDVLYNKALIRGPVSAGGLVDGGYHLFGLCCGLAALSPSMATVASDDGAHRRLGPVRIALLAVATLVAPTALFMQASPGPVTAGVAIAIFGAAVGVLVVVRLAISVRDHRRKTARLGAVEAASRDLVGAATEQEVVDSVRTALSSMLRPGASSDVCLATGPPYRDLTTPDGAPYGSLGRLTLPMPDDAPRTGSQRGSVRSSQTRVMRFIAPTPDLVELSPALEAVTEQANSALERIALVAKLRADERERYFRTLVLTSRDVTLISRLGRIDYATPSATGMFDRDVRGERVEDVVRLLAPDPASGHRSLTGDGREGHVTKSDGSTLTVLVRERDLSDDSTVSGVVTTLQDVTAERTLQRHLAYRASHDPLTGLANAEAFQDRLNEESTRDRRGRAALFVDLDDFKMINDTYGHDIGDRLLEVVARRIESCLRADDIAARLGGDEFAVLLTQVPNEDAARAVAQRIADALAEPAVIDGVGLSCQASIGLAYGPAGSTTLLREADAALYTAKASGKGRWSQYRQGMTTPTRSHANARQRIEHAIAAGDLTLHYQPIVDLATEEAVGFEALIRLQDSERPMTPQELIRVADDTGIITELGAWTIRQALRDTPRLNTRPGQSRYVSVNVSARQLRQPDFVDLVRSALGEAGADPSMLMLEVTEDLVVGNEYDRAWDFLAELRKDGIRIAIDDYGTGFASLSYLRQPGIDVVKIDKSFIAGATEPRGQTLLRHITALCLELNLGLIAEGIRDTATRDTVLELGCTWGQGFLYAQPMTLDEAANWTGAV